MGTIIYEDKDIILINKPAGVVSQNWQEIQNMLLGFIGKEWFVVHRLDQRVSGLILFALNKESLAKLNYTFSNRLVEKRYRAVTSIPPTLTEGIIEHWLLKDAKQKKAKLFDKECKGYKKAQLKYWIVKSSEKYHLLDIELYTGRFHQIRAQLSAIGCPIVGDVKYGYKRTTPDGSIFLQSYCLAFPHPKTQELLRFSIDMPDIWHKYGLSS